MSAETGLPLPLYTISIIIGSLVGFIALFVVVWNSSKTVTTIKLDIAQQKIQYEKDLASIEKKHIEDVEALKTEIQRQTIERRDDLTKAQMQLKDELNNVQKQLESSKSDIKSLLSKIEVAYTNIASSEKIHDEIKAELKTIMHFHSDWNQRIEDTNKDTVRMIENVRHEFLQMFTSFHGHGNNSDAT